MLNGLHTGCNKKPSLFVPLCVLWFKRHTESFTEKFHKIHNNFTLLFDFCYTALWQFNYFFKLILNYTLSAF